MRFFTLFSSFFDKNLSFSLKFEFQSCVGDGTFRNKN